MTYLRSDGLCCVALQCNKTDLLNFWTMKLSSACLVSAATAGGVSAFIQKPTTGTFVRRHFSFCSRVVERSVFSPDLFRCSLCATIDGPVHDTGGCFWSWCPLRLQCLRINGPFDRLLLWCLRQNALIELCMSIVCGTSRSMPLHELQCVVTSDSLYHFRARKAMARGFSRATTELFKNKQRTLFSEQ